MAGPVAGAETVEYSLTIAEQDVNYSGRPARAVTVNGGIPGPVLRFRDGDWARIHVHNRLSVPTSIHWHGILVPPGMDGVPYISFPPINPGATYTYEFPIRQAGTYWYHSHSELQEQRGLYGAIVIEPNHHPGHGHVHADRDHAVVLSDWTDEDPHAVQRELKRGSEWYAVEKGSAHSLLGAIRLGMLGDYVTGMLMRMPAMDISDVAYDRFLANGRTETMIDAKPGETARVRIIDGSATTYFHLEYAGGPMTVVSADGQDVEPVELRRILIGVAETYDVIVRVPAAGAYELRATAHDGSAFASIWIGSGERHPAPTMPRPNIYRAMGHLGLAQIFSLSPAGAMGMPDRAVEAGKFDRPGMTMHKNHDETTPMSGRHEMDGDAGKEAAASGSLHDHSMRGLGPVVHMGDHELTHGAERINESLRNGRRFGSRFGILANDVSSSDSLAEEGGEARPWAPYDKLRSVHSTAFSGGKPVRDIRLTLDGDMERYVWFLDNKALSETDRILVRRGEVVRFILINRTMMHHPMHLHGHFFRLMNGQGDQAPLKHTVDVAPMATTVIEFAADEFGDWFFHCHLLYHMHSGMARLIHYEGYSPDAETAAVRHRLYEESWYFHGRAELLSSMTEGAFELSDTRNIIRAEWEAGWQEVDKTEWEGILTWSRYIHGFLSVFAGADFEGAEGTMEKVRGIFGLRYRLPLDVECRAWMDTDAGGRVALEKHLELLPRLRLVGHVEYDTRHYWEGRIGLSYTIDKNVSLIGQWHSAYGWGAGVGIRF
ncbi:MAG: multicopper oxidase domain-containing protein [Deltaproteobacteria bacterium]|nr:multicopper oxidase domain-containing protein [Deltaproteobacteria bacterium]